LRWSQQAAWLFDQFQHGPTGPVLRRFGKLRPCHRRVIPRDRIAQDFQFRIGNSIEFHAKLENCHRYQLRGLSAGVAGEKRAALLEGCENRMHLLV
jgi:hypothetical protein